MRTSVDLPEPERPITTKTSPGQTSNETSRTAATQPVFARSSARGRSASGVPSTLSARWPKIFHTPSARISGGPLRSIRWPVPSDVPTVVVTVRSLLPGSEEANRAALLVDVDVERRRASR